MLLDRHSLKYQIPKLKKQNAQSPAQKNKLKLLLFCLRLTTESPSKTKSLASIKP